MLPYQHNVRQDDRVVIVGIGGAGANILQCFGGSSAANVRLCTMSLDERVGLGSGNVEFLQLGAGFNHGLGSGGDPEVARRAATESAGEIRRLIRGARLLVMVVGLGGGTGSGAAPMLAQMAKEAGLFLVTVAVMPFAFEGRRRRAQADAALEEVSRLSDIVYCFENDYMEDLFRGRPGARAVFEEANRLLAKATASVPMLSSSPGIINLGLDELAAALDNSDSRCLFGSGSGYGSNRAEDAARAALQSPLLAFRGAIRFSRCVIAHVAGGESMSLAEVRTAMETVRGALADDDVTLYFGTSVKPHLGDEMRLTLIASINGEELRQALENMPVPTDDTQGSSDADAAGDADDSESPDAATDAPAATGAPAADDVPPADGASSAPLGGSDDPGELSVEPYDEGPEPEPAAAVEHRPQRGDSLLEPEEPEFAPRGDGTSGNSEAWSQVNNDDAPASFVRPAARPSAVLNASDTSDDEGLFDVGHQAAPRYSREAAASYGAPAARPAAPTSPRESAVTARLRQGELMPGEQDDDELPASARTGVLFRDDYDERDADDFARAVDSDDLDIPPALRLNGLGIKFPDN